MTQEHDHTHLHDHGPEHTHDHGHEHTHEHDHEHPHGPEHEHTHDHEHGSDQPKAHSHPHTYADRPHPEFVVLDIGEDVGALIIHTRPERHAQEIHISPRGVAKREHVEVLERSIKGEPAFTAVFPELRQGEYDLWHDLHTTTPAAHATIIGGEITTLDWR